MSFALASASAFCARGELAVEIAELLVGKGGIVVADEKIGLRAVLFDLGLCLRQVCAQPFDLAREPAAGGAGLLLLGRLLEPQVGLGHGVGDLRGQLRALRFELDGDDARFLHLKCGKPLT